VELRSGDTSAGLDVEAVAEGVRAVAAVRDPEESLRALIDLAVRTTWCDGASITARGRGREVETVAYSDDRILKSDQFQQQLAEGPCRDAVWTDGLLLVRDVQADGRWPRWAPLAADLGVRSVLAVHLFTDTDLGALNLYSYEHRDFDSADVQVARVLAAHASVVLAHAMLQRNLWRAIETRNLIGQAQGILMARYGLTAEQAFAALRRCSQQRNVRVAALAAELTTTGHLQGLTDEDNQRVD
jgi:GAF domain-containing protein